MNGLSKGDAVFVVTVTKYYVGKIAEVVHACEGGALLSGYLLDEVSWVAHTGRLGEAFQTGKFRETEYYGGATVFVSAAVIVEMVRWQHALPK